jgi:rhodanese-related sulfurtransferase
MRKWLLTILAALVLTGCGAGAAEAPAYQQIGMSEAVERMAQESGYILLDVRTAEEFRDKHIPGAINIPNESIGTAEIPELPDKAQRIFVYCRSGNRSKQASEKLAQLGYTNVVEFGGINDWPGEVVTGAE